MPFDFAQREAVVNDRRLLQKLNLKSSCREAKHSSQAQVDLCLRNINIFKYNRFNNRNISIITKMYLELGNCIQIHVKCTFNVQQYI